MKRPMAFMQVLLEDSGRRHGISTTRDLKTITSRFEHEGLSFLTISLSSFGKDLEKALSQGYVDHDLFQGYAFTGGLPRLLGGFLDLVFDRKSGRLLDQPSIGAIRSLRQITLMWAKIGLPCSDERNRQAIESYIETEQEVRRADEDFVHDRVDDFRRIGRLLWREYFTVCDNSIAAGELVPKHGPGTTADGLIGNAKYSIREWTHRLEGVFPYWENALPSIDYASFTEDGLVDGVTYRSPGTERPVEVLLVPKTLKTPRIIAREPSYMQYMQQAVFELMTSLVPRFDNTRYFVKSDEDGQEINKSLARLGSLSGELATLDLSEASDRVSNQHVLALLADHPHFSEAVQATRSRKADVFGKPIRLAKFASMGSALCFPFESIVFTTVVFLGIERVLNRRLTKKDVQSFYGRVRVYGDDIIVPVDYAHSVIETLEAFGFKVNTNKSFVDGKFRESCGGDYYDGEDVSIVRMRSMFPMDRSDVSELESTVSFRNQLAKAGYGRSVEYLDHLIERIIPFPWVEEGSALLGRHGSWTSQPLRHDPHLHIPLVKGAWVETVLPKNPLDEHWALLKFHLKRGEQPSFDKEHLARSGRADSSRVKIGWKSPVSNPATTRVSVRISNWFSV